MSVQESPRPLKRSHDNFEGLADSEERQTTPRNTIEISPAHEEQQMMTSTTYAVPSSSLGPRDPSPARSNSGSLSDLGPTTPSCGDSLMVTSVAPENSANNSPSAFAALGTAPPPTKKTKLTFQEREMKRIQKEIKEQERAEERAKKEAERQAYAEEKARRDAEKEAERKRKEAEKEEKRLAQEAEKAAREEKRRQKEERKQKEDEAKRKKERSQAKLSNFFTPKPTTGRAGSVDSRERSSMSPAPSNPSLVAASTTVSNTPNKPQKTEYEKTFPDFFIHKDVTVAANNRFERDEEGTEAIQNTLDSYVLGNRSPSRQHPFDATFLFHLPSHDVPRGIRCMPVREIMAEFRGGSSRPIDLTTDSQNSHIKKMQDLLRKVPFKILQFREDVRPPYRGTYTSRPVSGMAKLARNPLRRDLPNTNYDYDSEAEWVEDEDAEDCNSDGEEEEDIEDTDEMDGFLDDENDDTANSRRMVLQGDLEPVSTGLCWEDRRKRNTNVKMMPYRMEIIIGEFFFFRSMSNLTAADHTMKTIDPFSTAYWEPRPVTAMDPPRMPLTAMKTPNSINQAAKPVKPFFSNASIINSTPSQPVQHVGKDNKPKKLLPAEVLSDFRAAIQGNNLSKVGLVEVLKKQFPSHSAQAIKNTLEMIAKRVGNKEVDKRWVLVDNPAV
ncbi:hypothetical protein G7Y89_g9505 [Cudoniella acicularis]|uniref:Chromatin assembly factor 1 subunit A n=1 Tax=Cudoniella acicularis TaxID=354080 RepID=A0A8H4VZK4_9HELO|nr:hypothetical protein G7Y89_g9505 [Cudoniella acicularis]